MAESDNAAPTPVESFVGSSPTSSTGSASVLEWNSNSDSELFQLASPQSIASSAPVLAAHPHPISPMFSTFSATPSPVNEIPTVVDDRYAIHWPELSDVDVEVLVNTNMRNAMTDTAVVREDNLPLNEHPQELNALIERMFRIELAAHSSKRSSGPTATVDNLMTVNESSPPSMLQDASTTSYDPSSGDDEPLLSMTTGVTPPEAEPPNLDSAPSLFAPKTPPLSAEASLISIAEYFKRKADERAGPPTDSLEHTNGRDLPVPIVPTATTDTAGAPVRPVSAASALSYFSPPLITPVELEDTAPNPAPAVPARMPVTHGASGNTSVNRRASVETASTSAVSDNDNDTEASRTSWANWRQPEPHVHILPSPTFGPTRSLYDPRTPSTTHSHLLPPHSDEEVYFPASTRTWRPVSRDSSDPGTVSRRRNIGLFASPTRTPSPPLTPAPAQDSWIPMPATRTWPSSNILYDSLSEDDSTPSTTGRASTSSNAKVSAGSAQRTNAGPPISYPPPSVWSPHTPVCESINPAETSVPRAPPNGEAEKLPIDVPSIRTWLRQQLSPPPVPPPTFSENAPAPRKRPPLPAVPRAPPRSPAAAPPTYHAHAQPPERPHIEPVATPTPEFALQQGELPSPPTPYSSYAQALPSTWTGRARVPSPRLAPPSPAGTYLASDPHRPPKNQQRPQPYADAYFTNPINAWGPYIPSLSETTSSDAGDFPTGMMPPPPPPHAHGSPYPPVSPFIPPSLYTTSPRPFTFGCWGASTHASRARGTPPQERRLRFAPSPPQVVPNGCSFMSSGPPVPPPLFTPAPAPPTGMWGAWGASNAPGYMLSSPAAVIPPMPPGPGGAGWYTPSIKYSFSDASVIFRVETSLYRVHRHFFERHSEYFVKLLSTYYFNETSHVFLPDVKRADFEALLSIFYPDDLTKSEITTVAGWTGVLALTQTWSMAAIRALALQRIGQMASAVEKIAIAHKHGLRVARGSSATATTTTGTAGVQSTLPAPALAPAWLLTAFIDVCAREAPLAPHEAAPLDVETVLGIWEVQHAVAAAARSGVRPFGSGRTANLERLVTERFGPFEHPAQTSFECHAQPSFAR